MTVWPRPGDYVDDTTVAAVFPSSSTVRLADGRLVNEDDLEFVAGCNTGARFTLVQIEAA